MFVFTSVVVIGFKPSTVKRFVFEQELRPGTVIERKINITHILNHIHGSGSGSGSRSVIRTSVVANIIMRPTYFDLNGQL